jgi:hypothetical protein
MAIHFNFTGPTTAPQAAGGNGEPRRLGCNEPIRARWDRAAAAMGPMDRDRGCWHQGLALQEGTQVDMLFKGIGEAIE